MHSFIELGFFIVTSLRSLLKIPPNLVTDFICCFLLIISQLVAEIPIFPAIKESAPTETQVDDILWRFSTTKS